MKKQFIFFLALFATVSLWAGNVITYTASAKLNGTTNIYSYGLHTNAFNVSISSHTFADGTGTITFSGEVTSIGERAFYDCRELTSVTIPNSVTSIGDLAFDGCSSLMSVTIPNSVTSIGKSAFGFCTELMSVTIGESVKTIGDRAFDHCRGLTNVMIPNSVTSIGNDAFNTCVGLASMTIPNSVTSIGNYAFYDCSGLTSVTIPKSVMSIGNWAFRGCSGLTSVHISDLAAWCGIAFRDDFANPLYYAHKLVLTGQEVTNLVIPDVVTSIGSFSFGGCSSLISVTIPASVTSIGDYAFDDCSGLTSVTCKAMSPPTCGEHSFKSVDKSIPVYVLTSAMTAYYAASVWKDFTNILPYKPMLSISSECEDNGQVLSY